MACEDGLQMFGFADTVFGRCKMIERLKQRAVEEKKNNQQDNQLTKSWYLGTKEFSEKILPQAEHILKKQRSRAYNSSTEYKSHNLQQAQLLFDEGLKKSKLTQQALLHLSGSDPRKVFLAMLIRKKTTVSNSWLAENLKMKSAANVSRLLKKYDVKKLTEHLPSDLINYAKIEN